MFQKVVYVEPRNNYSVFLRFDNNKEGIVDLSSEIWGEAFEKLKDPHFFKKVQLLKDIGTIGWSNGVDIAPEFLYEHCK